MGLDMTARDPWSNRSILIKLVSTRDGRIDELIKKKLCEQDEMSNASVATIPRSQRCKCYHAASIPDVITLEFPQFEMQNGQQHQSVAIDVLSTHIKPIVEQALEMEAAKNAREAFNLSVDEAAAVLLYPS